MAVSLDTLPKPVQAACAALREQLTSMLGTELIALWVYGAAVFDDRPSSLGDVDTHAVLRSVPQPETLRAIDDAHDRTAQRYELEWDSWYVLEHEMRSAAPPSHALRENLTDQAWALHRAHWLAGKYVLLHGPNPSELVPVPAWRELEAALQHELRFLEAVLREGPRDVAHAAFATWQCCRILYSTRSRDVVISKRQAAHWALGQLPAALHPAIHAAERAYDGTPGSGDRKILMEGIVPIYELLKEALEAEP